MKHLFALPLLVLPLVSVANPYLKLGYGFSSITSNEATQFSAGTVSTQAPALSLEPKGSDGIWQVTAGYNLSQRFALEGSIQGFQADASHESIVQDTTQTNPLLSTQEYNWDTKIDALRLSIKSLYLLQFDNELQLRTGLGLTVTQYDFTAGTSREAEISDAQLGSIPGVTTRPNRSETSIGAVATIGVDYPVWQNFTLGADANLSIDGVTSTAELLGTVGYHF